MHIRVSIKNDESELTESKVQGFLDLIHSSMTEPFHLVEPPLAISLLINVGSGNMDPLIRLSSQDEGGRHLQMALPLKDKSYFVDIPDEVRDRFLRIAEYHPRVRSQPAMKLGYQISQSLGLQDELRQSGRGSK